MKKMLILSVTLLILFTLFLIAPKTNVNYDMTKYLPSDSITKEGMAILIDEFGEESMIQILVNDIEVSDLLFIKNEIFNVPYVLNVIWLDNYVDLTLVPIAFIDQEIVLPFYQDNDALITIIFDTDAYDTNLDQSISDIKNLLIDYDLNMRGEPLINMTSRDVASGETSKILYLIIPVIILLLVLSSHAYVEPILILITLGIAVLFNLFTNGFLPNVSFITQTMSLALQLALSIDYALFMIHRFYEERENHDALISSRLALNHSLKPITISALTTIAGFAALSLMKFSIGLDMSLVLSKGIIFSYLSTIILLPTLLFWFDKLITKTKHSMFFPSLKHLVKIQLRFKYYIFGLLLIIIGFGFIMQRNTNFLFGANALGDHTTVVGQDLEIIDQRFGQNHQLVILIPNETVTQEVNLVSDLVLNSNIISVNALVTAVDPLVPRELIPAEVLNYYVGDSYSRIIVNTSIYTENSDLYAFVDDIKLIINSHYDSFYLVGQPSALTDIKDSIEAQGIWIMVLTVVAVGLIVGLIFKSFKIPLILVSIILGAIWLNMSILVISDQKVLYIGYLIVMSIQLGATIDYAVLLTHRYLEERKTKEKEKAMEIAFTKSSVSIMISGMILTFAGFIEGIFSNIDSVTKIGLLLGRGALISLLMILIFLPVVLLVLDKFIVKEK